jgi:hypothetical protein
VGGGERDQPLLLFAGRQHAPAGVFERVDRRMRVGQRDLDQRALERDRRA